MIIHIPIQINTIVAMMTAVKVHMVPQAQSENTGHATVANHHLSNWLLSQVLASINRESSGVNPTDVHGHAQL